MRIYGTCTCCFVCQRVLHCAPYPVDLSVCWWCLYTRLLLVTRLVLRRRQGEGQRVARSERVPWTVTVHVVFLADMRTSSVCIRGAITTTTLEETEDVQEIEHGHLPCLHTTTTGLLFIPCIRW